MSILRLGTRKLTGTYHTYIRRESINTTIALFTVTVANEAGVDLVLIQPFLLYYAKLVVVMLTSIF